MSDPATYRTKQEVARAKEDDPILSFRDDLLAEGALTDEQFSALQKSSRQQAAESVTFAEQSPEPPIEELYDYTYARTS